MRMRAICGCSSEKRTIGPAISFGKKVTKKAYSVIVAGRMRPFLQSARYEICSNVKNEIARGRTMCVGLFQRPALERFAEIQFAYLNQANKPTSAMMPKTKMVLTARTNSDSHSHDVVEDHRSD